MAFTKEFLSGGSGDGRSVKVAATATPGTLIHTAHATAKDEVYLWAVNSSSSIVQVTIEWGDVVSPDDLISYDVQPNGTDPPIVVVPGWILSNSDAIRAFAGTTNVVTINGFVNRIT